MRLLRDIGQLLSQRLVDRLPSPTWDPHRRALVLLARRAQAFDLPMPLAIFPDNAQWSVKVADVCELVSWSRALGFNSTFAMRPLGSARQRWTAVGKLAGVQVLVWSPAVPPAVAVFSPAGPEVTS